jgi:hypothetical protein
VTVAVPRVADIDASRPHERFVPILLQKSRRGFRIVDAQTTSRKWFLAALL